MCRGNASCNNTTMTLLCYINEGGKMMEKAQLKWKEKKKKGKKGERKRKKRRKKMENPGIDPGTSRMLSERSTI